MITPAVTIEEGNQITREISVSSAQTADAVVKYVYGRKLAMPDACVSCRVGNGVFRRCVVLDAISPGCANCQYGCRSHTYAKAPDFPASEKADVDVLVNALADVPMKAVQQSCVLLAQAVNITVVSRGGEDITASNLSADMREAFGFTLLKAVGYLVALGPDDVTTGRFTFGHVCRSHKCSAAPDLPAAEGMELMGKGPGPGRWRKEWRRCPSRSSPWLVLPCSARPENPSWRWMPNNRFDTGVGG